MHQRAGFYRTFSIFLLVCSGCGACEETRHPPLPKATALELTAPGTAQAGQAVDLSVRAMTAQGETAKSYLGSVRFISSDPQALLAPDYTFSTSDDGSHHFTDVILRTAGGQTLTVSDIADPALRADAHITVAPGPLTSFVLSGIPPSLTAGTDFTASVLALDEYGNIATTYAGTVTFSSTDPKAVLPLTYTFGSGDAGLHVFSGLLMRTSGSYQVCVHDGMVQSCATVNVLPGPIDKFALIGVASPSSACEAQAVTVTALDFFGNIVIGYTGGVTFTISDTLATIPSPYTFNQGDAGVHKFVPGVTFRSLGQRTLRVYDSGNPGIFGEVSVQVVPGPAASLELSGLPLTMVAGEPQTVTVSAWDACGYIASGYSGTVRFVSSDPQAVLPPDYTFTAPDAGIHSFVAGVTMSSIGLQTVSVSDLMNPLIFGFVTVNVTSGELRVMVTDRESGLPITGAIVMVGTSPGVPFTGNWGLTDSSGIIIFTDAPGKQTVTAGNAGYAYLSLINTWNKNIILPLRPTAPWTPVIVGNTNGTPENPSDPSPPANFNGFVTPNCDDDMDISIALPAQSYEGLLGFNLASLLGPFITSMLYICSPPPLFCSSCLNPYLFSLFPSNVLGPWQQEVVTWGGTNYAFRIGKLEYFVLSRPNTLFNFSGIGGSVPRSVVEAILADLTRFTDLLTQLDYKGFAYGRDIPVGATEIPDQPFNMTTPVTANLTVNLGGMPPSITTLVLAGAELTTSTVPGKLLLTGLSGGNSSSVSTITLTTVDTTGIPSLSDMRIVPGAIVIDMPDPLAPPGGFVAVLDRTGYPSTGSPINTTINTFFTIPAVNSAPPQDLSWSDVKTVWSPAPHLSWSFLGYVYPATVGSMTFNQTKVSWEVLAEGTAQGFTLPVLPPGSPIDPPPPGNGYQWTLAVLSLNNGVGPYDFHQNPDFSYILNTATHDAGIVIPTLPSVLLSSPTTSTCSLPCTQTTVEGYVLLGSLAGAEQVLVQSSAGSPLTAPVSSDGYFSTTVQTFEPVCPGEAQTSITVTPQDALGNDVLPSFNYVFTLQC